MRDRGRVALDLADGHQERLHRRHVTSQ
jgi:hypothetical protein